MNASGCLSLAEGHKAPYTSLVMSKKTEVVSPFHSLAQVPVRLRRQPRSLLLSSPGARGRSNKTTAFPISPLASWMYNVGLDTVKKKKARHNLPGLADRIFLGCLASTS